MGDAGSNRPQRRQGFCPAGLVFQLDALADVGDGRNNQVSAFGPAGVGQANLNEKLAPILASSDQVEPQPHRTTARCSNISLTVLDMPVTETLGKQQLDRLPNQFLKAVTEDLRLLWI